MQTSVDPKGQPVAFAGLVADSDELQDVVSGFSEEPSASMAFGWGLVQGSAPQGCLIPSGSGDTFKGILAHSFMHAPGTFGDLDATGIVAGGRLRIMRHGRIWVVLDAGVSSISPYVDRGWLRYSSNGGNTIPGRWGKATDVGHNLDLTKVVQYVSPMFTLADGTKIAMVDVSATNKP